MATRNSAKKYLNVHAFDVRAPDMVYEMNIPVYQAEVVNG